MWKLAKTILIGGVAILGLVVALCLCMFAWVYVKTDYVYEWFENKNGCAWEWKAQVQVSKGKIGVAFMSAQNDNVYLMRITDVGTNTLTVGKIAESLESVRLKKLNRHGSVSFSEIVDIGKGKHSAMALWMPINKCFRPTNENEELEVVMGFNLGGVTGVEEHVIRMGSKKIPIVRIPGW